MGDRYMMILVYLSILTALLFSEVSCNVGDDCSAGVAACGNDPPGTGYQCVSNQCQCTTDYYADANNICTAKPVFNEECDTSTTTPKPCRDGVGLICTDDGTGTNEKCTCDTRTHYVDNSQCSPKKGYGEPCTSAEMCNLEHGSCHPINTGSTESTCSCNENYYTDNNACKPVADLKPTGVTQGATTSNSVTITWTVTVTADAIQSFNVKGDNPFIETPVSDKTQRMVMITGLTPNTQYSNIKVETIVTTDRNPSLVVTSDQSISFKTPQAGYREPCVLSGPTDQCSYQNSECVELPANSGHRCYCKEGFYSNNIQCNNAQTDLKTIMANVTPQTNTATVTWTLQQASNSQFISSFSIEVNGTINKTNIGNSATSSEITGLQPGTVYSIIVISIVNTDRNPNYQVESEAVSTTTKQVYDGICNLNGEPLCTGNLQCINNKCGCQNSHYVFNNYCYPKLGYDGDCSNSSQACITDYECYTETDSSRCKCKSGQYRTTDECRQVSELKPTNFGVIDSTASSLTFTWNVLSATYITEYIISGDSFQNTTIQKAARTGTVSGLSPGTDYTNIKITAKVRTDRGSFVEDAVSDQTLADSTNPGEPGPLNSTKDYDATKVMYIEFVRPTGGVDNYSVEITGPGLTISFKQEPTSNIITVPANTTQPGRNYSISIIAVYKGKNSIEFTDTFLTRSRGSDPVKNLTITNITSRNLTVSWLYPDEDMGVLTAFVLDVKIGNECIQQFIFVSNINNKPMSTNCEGVTSIDIVISDLKAGVIQSITDLLPFINYTLIVTPYNAAGRGSEASESALTLIEAAGEPSNLKVPEIKATSFHVTWTKSDLKTGPTTYYLNLYEQSELANNQATQFVKMYPVPGFDIEEYEVNDVVSYWYYRVELQASTSVGNSSILNMSEFQTLSSAPGKVESLVVSPIDDNYTSATVRWDCIKERNRHGILKNYTLTSTLENEVVKVIPHNENCKFTETVRVKPGETIQFVVYATNMDFKGEESQKTYKAPTGNPILPQPDKILFARSEEIGQTSFSVNVCPSCLMDETNGPVEITALLVCRQGKCDVKDEQLTLEGIKNFRTWKKAQANSFDSPYRVTNSTWYGSKVVDKVTFVVGSETESYCDKQGDTYFCNGPLNMDTEYQILAVSCTEGGCSISEPLGSFTTKPEDTDIVTPVVVSIVVILVVVAVILGGVFIYKRRKNHQPVDELSIHSVDSITTKPTIPRYRPIKLEHFEEQIANLQKDSNLLFSEEFEGIGELSPRHDSLAAQKDENKPKNRYVNILAFDHSRVKLLPIDDDETTDYINANYIPGYKSQREYIATQGPLITNVGGVDISTIPDFWRMIWEQRVAIIVMLSDLTEKGKPKVDKYWKDQGESEQYGDIIVEVTSVSVLNKYTIKIFEMKLGEEVRKVRHFFLPGWEDYRANLQPEDVLEFLSVVRQEVKPIDKGPMVVHCSAGVGRTGTFIALDIFQQYINERDMSSDIDIYDLVLRMRNFRQNMVQSEKQYIFIHETIKEIISQRKKRLQDNDNAIYENTGYSNEAFVPDDIYQNVENGKPTTTL